MNVLMVEPGKVPYETEIGSDLASLQAAVGGDIQAVYPYEEPVALICNEEGKLMDLPLNRALRDEDGEIYDIVAGKFFLVGLGEDSFTDIAPEYATKFAEQFRHSLGRWSAIACTASSTGPRKPQQLSSSSPFL